MLKKILDLIIPSVEQPAQIALRTIPRDQHSVSRKNISPSAVKVLYRLNNSGFKAFLVGGGVRDIILGNQPKDFDIATEATPDQVKDLFGNCRLIGRRFRLAHIRFGREIIEVATFRAGHENSETGNIVATTSQQGQILRDNVYGNQQEDALRRDFTVNALYYSVKDFCIYDYTSGMDDLNNRVLRLIGDPHIRYREDPVRMLRAARFAAKLDFQIEERTAKPIPDLGKLLLNIPPARLFEEVLKLFLSGKGLATFIILRQLGLFQFLFPETDKLLASEADCATELIRVALVSTDKRINADKPVTPAFLYATMLWPVLIRQRVEYLKDGLPVIQATQKAAQRVIENQVKHTSLPRRFSLPMKEIWELQERLPKHQSRKKAESLTEHPRFRAAYDFLLLREESGENLGGLGAWWTNYQIKNPLSSPASHNKQSTGFRRPRRSGRHRKLSDNS